MRRVGIHGGAGWGLVRSEDRPYRTPLIIKPAKAGVLLHGGRNQGLSRTVYIAYRFFYILFFLISMRALSSSGNFFEIRSKSTRLLAKINLPKTFETHFKHGVLTTVKRVLLYSFEGSKYNS